MAKIALLSASLLIVLLDAEVQAPSTHGQLGQVVSGLGNSMMKLGAQVLGVDCMQEFRTFVGCMRKDMPAVPRDAGYAAELKRCAKTATCIDPTCVADTIIQLMPRVMNICGMELEDIGMDVPGIDDLVKVFAAAQTKEERELMYERVCDEKDLHLQPKTLNLTWCMMDKEPPMGGVQQGMTRLDRERDMMGRAVGCALGNPQILTCAMELQTKGCDCAKNEQMKRLIVDNLLIQCGVTQDLTQFFEHSRAQF